MQTVKIGDHAIVEGPPGATLLASVDDVAEIIGACYEHGSRAVLLYAENLTPRFFDISSGEAGAVLQKLRNYRVRLAVVVPEGGSQESSRFREMVADEMHGNEFRLFSDREMGEAWLAQDII